ncbi:MAG: hypothetical protein M1834_000214 [Cirrosporium novae-zelandiae]|nr:MAG: hypothetical protein M1834_000214 [Cirrosporium novae-zelandiae]
MRAIILATGALALVVTCDSIFDGKGNSWKHPRADISSLSQTNSVVSSSQTYSTTGKAESLTSDTVENAAISTSTTSTKTDAKVKSTTVGSTKTTPTIATATATTSSKSSHSDALPIKIHITPALGVAGVILILTGIWHTLVGIKNKPIQTFLSTTYLVGMSVTVLIIYVMSPPISDAVQGAFLVAACLSGILFGLGSLLFREVAEALGCVLGGFTLNQED